MIRGIKNAISIAKALGIGAASFWSEAEKDIAESPTALPERPRKKISYAIKKSFNIVKQKLYYCVFRNEF